MKISASVYSSKTKNLLDTVNELDKHNVDFFHIDCNDDLNVFADIQTITEVSDIPIDLHIISSDPEKYIDLINSHKIYQVTFQYENLTKVYDFKTQIKNCKVGIAFTSNTDLSAYENYKSKVDYILFMTTTPGQSGGKFNKETFRRIRKFSAANPEVPVQVDGGVNGEVSFILRNMGVDSAVVGSYLFTQDFIGQALLNLRHHNVESEYVLSDFMIEANELPVLQLQDSSSLLEALEKIEKYKLGFLIAVDSVGKMSGIISNADVRKGLIKHYQNIQTIKANDLLNSKPLSIKENKTISDLLALIKKQTFPVTYLPVVDSENILKGAITFNNLIKGES